MCVGGRRLVLRADVGQFVLLLSPTVTFCCYWQKVTRRRQKENVTYRRQNTTHLQSGLVMTEECPAATTGASP